MTVWCHLQIMSNGAAFKETDASGVLYSNGTCVWTA
jgi:hypothetical protein